jgi:AIG2-like family
MSKILYFAYSSNMDVARLRYRVPSCRFRCIARLEKFQLRFHKRSKDGSGKCNAFYTGAPRDAVFGMVYEIPLKERAALDRAEGLGHGYYEQPLSVLSPDGEKLLVRTYIADPGAVDENLRPYSWYKDFVLSGAVEHQLPSEYIESRIRSVPAIVDPDQDRERTRRAETRP